MSLRGDERLIAYAETLDCPCRSGPHRFGLALVERSRGEFEHEPRCSRCGMDAVQAYTVHHGRAPEAVSS